MTPHESASERPLSRAAYDEIHRAVTEGAPEADCRSTPLRPPEYAHETTPLRRWRAPRAAGPRSGPLDAARPSTRTGS